MSAGDTVRADFALETEALRLSGIAVSVLRPTLRPRSELEGRLARETNPRDVGDLLRRLPGVSSVRRGALGLDPVVRGLRETEVGVYLDGTRQFPAGPARMDSPLSHLDPSTLDDIEVVKGPYALTWGAGNMSAIRVRTQTLPPPASGPWHGRMLTGYDANLDAKETSASLNGSHGRVSYWGSGAWREGESYTTGSGADIPAGYRSWEARGKLGYALSPASELVLSGGYQKQNDIDYPGLILDAKYFRTVNGSAEWTLHRPTGSLRDLDVLAYMSDVDHAMDNDHKPTALPNPDRTPPFPLDVAVDAGIRVYGGRATATLSSSPYWEVEVGGDVYRTLRRATRTIHRRDTGMLMFTDLMWPGAALTDGGIFARATHTLPRVSVAGTCAWTRCGRAPTRSAISSRRTWRPVARFGDRGNVSGALTVSFQPGGLVGGAGGRLGGADGGRDRAVLGPDPGEQGADECGVRGKPALKPSGAPRRTCGWTVGRPHPSP